MTFNPAEKRGEHGKWTKGDFIAAAKKAFENGHLTPSEHTRAKIAADLHGKGRDDGGENYHPDVLAKGLRSKARKHEANKNSSMAETHRNASQAALKVKAAQSKPDKPEGASRPVKDSSARKARSQLLDSQKAVYDKQIAEHGDHTKALAAARGKTRGKGSADLTEVTRKTSDVTRLRRQQASEDKKAIQERKNRRRATGKPTPDPKRDKYGRTPEEAADFKKAVAESNAAVGKAGEAHPEHFQQAVQAAPPGSRVEHTVVHVPPAQAPTQAAAQPELSLDERHMLAAALDGNALDAGEGPDPVAAKLRAGESLTQSEMRHAADGAQVNPASASRAADAIKKLKIHGGESPNRPTTPPSTPPAVAAMDRGAEFAGHLKDGSTVWHVVTKRPSGMEQDRTIVHKDGTTRNATDADLQKVTQEAPKVVGPKPPSNAEILKRQRAGSISHDRANKLRADRAKWEEESGYNAKRAAARKRK